MPAPVLVSLGPNSGPQSGGTTVNITGLNFQTPPITTVLFGTVMASFAVVDDTHLTAVSPAQLSPGTVDVQLVNNAGVSAPSIADRFTYTADAPLVTSLDPSSGSTDGGNLVTVHGDHFLNATDVSFGATTASFSVGSDTQIDAIAPAHAAGTVDVVVTTPSGSSDITAADHYTYASPPTVTSVVPNHGDPAGGTTVTITGTRFTGATAVNFGPNSAQSFTVDSDTQITATSPPGTGTVDVTVTADSLTSPTSPADQFTYVDVHVSEVHPNIGPDYGGDTVTIFGSGFDTTPNSTYVFFGDQIQGDLNVIDSTALSVTSLPQPPGVYRVTVWVNGVYSTDDVFYTYEHRIPPQTAPQPAACAASRVFDAPVPITAPGELSTAPDQILSFCDRLPAGRYAIQRTVPPSLASVAAVAGSVGMRGVAFYLGDSDLLPSDPTTTLTPYQHRRLNIQWAPNPDHTAQPWQQLQLLLAADGFPTAPTTSQMCGSQTFRNQHKLVGGFFVCGSSARQAPAAAGKAIAGIKNTLCLDFMLVDISDLVWNTPGSPQAAVALFQAIHESTVRNSAGNAIPVVSTHYPTFAIVPQLTTDAPNLLSPDGIFEPTANGYTGPKTFIAPRIIAGTTAVDQVWQWARPPDGTISTMSRCEPVIDCRFGDNPAASATAFTTRTSISLGAQVYSGALFFDDLDHLSGGVGPQPTSYWNYDQDLPNPQPVKGAIVPVADPDPLPLAQTDHDWAVLDATGNRVYFKIGFENWKTGHASPNNRPGWVIVSDSNCSTTQHTLRSWVKLNGTLISTTNFASTYGRGISDNFLEFSGVPVAGDDGSYPFLIEVRRGPTDLDLDTSFSFALLVVDLARVKNDGGNFTSSTGVPIPYPDIAASASYASSLHPTLPSPTHVARTPNDWGTTAQFCRGTTNVTSDQPGQLPPFPLPPRQVGSRPRTDIACGYSYTTDWIQAAVDGCTPTTAGATPLPICNSVQSTADYIGFVFAVIAALSNFDPLYQSGTQAGLFSLDTTRGPGQGHTTAQLQNPAVSLDLAQNSLQAAWLGEVITNCNQYPYETRVANAYLNFVTGTGIYPGSTPTAACSTVTNGPQPRGLAQVGQTAACFRTAYTQASTSPTAPPSLPIQPQQPGQPSPTPGCISICQALQLAIDAGWDNVQPLDYHGATAAQTIVAISMSETLGPAPGHGHSCGNDPQGNPFIGPTDILGINQCGVPGVNALGILQFCPNFHPEVSQNMAFDPATAYREALRVYLKENFSSWGSYTTPPNYRGYIDLVKSTQPCSRPTYTPGPPNSLSLTAAQQVGQLLMIGLTPGGNIDAQIQNQHVGNVVLFGNGWSTGNTTSTTTHLQSITQTNNAGIGALISGNQEGGDYQAFTGGSFSSIPSALDQAQLSTATLQANAQTWASQLKAAGVNHNLAPVCDVTPPGAHDASDPEGRTYGHEPTTAARAVAAFIKGMDAAGVATTAKHYPGLGGITGNTDTTTVGITDNIFVDMRDPTAQPFSAANGAQVDSIMVSNAYYPNAAETATTPAFASHNIVTGLIRGAMNYNGVIVTDDIGQATPATTAYPDPGVRAVAAIRAGCDLILTVRPSDAAPMAAALLSAMQSDPAFATLVASSVNRILAMKQRRGVPIGTPPSPTPTPTPQPQPVSSPGYLGCPVSSTSLGIDGSHAVCLSAGCGWHQRVEGQNSVNIATYGSTQGLKLFATCSGTLVYKDWDPGVTHTDNNPAGHYGVDVILHCDNNPVDGNGELYIRYGHCQSTSLSDPTLPRRDQHVIQGQHIAYLGQTGHCTGPTVHYMLWTGMSNLDIQIATNPLILDQYYSRTICPTSTPSGQNLLGQGCIISICPGADL